MTLLLPLTVGQGCLYRSADMAVVSLGTPPPCDWSEVDTGCIGRIEYIGSLCTHILGDGPVCVDIEKSVCHVIM